MDADLGALDSTTEAALRMASRWRILMLAWLSHRPEPATIYEIAEGVGSDATTLRRHLSILEQLDLVTANLDRNQRAGRSVMWSVNEARLYELRRALQALFDDDV